MKNYFLSLIFLCISSFAMSQSNVAYLYSSEILQDYPKYIEVKAQLDKFAENSKANIDVDLNQAKVLFEIYNKSAKSMPLSELKNLESMIIKIEKKANDLQQSIFGQGGDFDKKQKELMLPVEKNILLAVEKLSKMNGYDMVFDLSIIKNTIYQSSRINITEQIKKELGIVNKRK